MTQTSVKIKNTYALLKSFFVFAAFLLFSVFASNGIAGYTFEGMMLAIKVIVPTVFPFMIFSDIASRCFEFEKSNFLSSAFERLFKISRVGICAVFSSIAGGFPIGAKNAIELYNDGKISKCECERLMCFSNVPSPAYVISAIGLGMFSNLKIGIILYASVLISAFFTGILIGFKRNYSIFTELKLKQNYSFVTSVKNSAAASVNIIFFISIFSAICGLIKSLPIKAFLKCVLMAFSEVGNAALYISDLCIFDFKLSVALIAFSLSFSGFSVIMQSLALNKNKELSIKKCVLYKTLQGIISFIIILLLPI